MGVTREKLYDEVWREPMTTVAKRYKVSSNFLARVCRRLNVPVPTRGYWARRAAGQRLEHPILPTAEPWHSLVWRDDGAGERLALAINVAPVVKKENITRHPLVIAATEHFAHVRTSNSMFGSNYLRPYKHGVIDLLVTKEMLTSALNTMNALFVALARLGHRVALPIYGSPYRRSHPNYRRDNEEPRDDYSDRAWSGPDRPTLAFFGSVAIGLTLFEISENVDARWDSALSKWVRAPRERNRARFDHSNWTTKRWMPTGLFGVHAYAPYRGVTWEKYWHEPKTNELRSMIDAVVDELANAAPSLTTLIEERVRKDEEERIEEERRRVEEEKRERAREVAEAKAREKHRIAEAERRKLTKLTEEIERWRFARDARAMIAELKSLAADQGLRMIRGGDIEQWADWVLAKADDADPLAQFRKDVAETAAQFGTFPRPPSPLGAMRRLRKQR